MKRRDIIGGLLITATIGRAQAQQTRPPRLGYLTDEIVATHPLHSQTTILDRLRERGYVNGRDIVIDYRYAEENYGKLPSLAAELAAIPVDVILAVGTPATSAALAATKTIPIVFARVGDPIGFGLVKDLARPGGFLTGVSVFLSELIAKRLQVLKDLVPGLDRLAIIYEPDFPPSVGELKGFMAAAPSLDMQIQAVAARTLAALEGALPDVTKESPRALFVGSSILFEDHATEVVQFAKDARLPALYVRQEYVEAGGLVCYGVSYREMYRQAADYLVRILKGAKPADLPVLLPSKIELTINLRTANALGLAIPPSLLARADEVIE